MARVIVGTSAKSQKRSLAERLRYGELKPLGFNVSLRPRVWTHFIQHLIANRYSIDLKLHASFSKRELKRRMSFILQKKRSTMLRMA